MPRRFTIEIEYNAGGARLLRLAGNRESMFFACEASVQSRYFWTVLIKAPHPTYEVLSDFGNLLALHASYSSFVLNL